jgi:hypothetical protein
VEPHPSYERVADRLAHLLVGGDATLSDPGRGDLEFESDVRPRRLERGSVPGDVWAVDGGQGLVLDARCVQVVATRVASVRYVGGRCAVEDEGELEAHLIGAGESRAAVTALGLGVAPDAGLDGVVNLLRDGAEWKAVARCVGECEPDGMVLVDGDLQPDWRVPSTFVAGVLATARERGVTLVGVTKHSSLARGGAPLVGALELEGASSFGDRGMWWAPVARTRADLAAHGSALQVVAARLDPSAPFAFRVDLPADVEAEPALRRLSALADDAAFPGYPYPLTVADRLAACPRWLCDDLRSRIDERFDLLRIPLDLRERAFADRHRLMERS